MTSTTLTGAEPILLAFSGGLDTSFCVPWLKDTYRRPVITVTVDTGGIDADAAASLERRSVQLGAIEHHLIDARAAYFDQVLKYLIMGNVRRGGLYPLSVGAERVLQAQTIAQMALHLGTTMVAHGCTAAGNDQVVSNPRPAERHTVGFAAGVPVSLDGVTQSAVSIIEQLESLAGPFGIGRGIHLGDTVIGTKGRVAFEAPAADVLLTAHRELEKLVLTGKQARIKETVAQPYGDLLHEGQHLDPACRDIEALLASSQARVTGEVRVLFRPGSVFIEGVTSPFSLMAASKGVYGEAAGEWTPTDALGYSKMLALTGIFYKRAGTKAAAEASES